MDLHADSNLGEAQAAVDAVAASIQTELPKVVKVLGVQLLSFVRLNFREKSRGGGGMDNTPWKPLAASTIAMKMGKSTAKRNRARKSQKTKVGGKKRPLGGVAIGIDTGILFSSSVPGYSAPDGGGNIFVLDPTNLQVKVGFSRKYATYFDMVRPLIPKLIPPAWQAKLEATAANELLKIVGGAFDK